MSARARSQIVVSGTSSGTGSGEITPLLDVADPAQIGAAAGAVAGHTGGAELDGLVNNAGIGVFGPLEIIPVEQFRRQLEVNVTGQLAVSQALLPLLRRARDRIEPASIHTQAVRMDRRFQVSGRSGCLGSTLPGQQPDSAGAGDMRLAGRLVRQEEQHLWRTP